VTFHARGANWGIYIPLSSLAFLMGRVFGHLKADPTRLLSLSFRVLHQHELFHFAVDYMAAQCEVLLGRPCHRPARSLRDPQLDYIVLEEECANAHMLRALRHTPHRMSVEGKSVAVQGLTRKQPRGYHYLDCFPTSRLARFAERCEQLARSYVGCIPELDTSRLHGADLSGLYPLRPAIDWRHVPLHIIDNGARFNLPSGILGLFRSIEGPIKESSKFQTELARLPERIRKAWDRLRERLAVSTSAAGTDFKQWERAPAGPIYSARVSKSHRVHLQYVLASRSWWALSVGTHGAMGHG
jgi:hypothetical protein